MKRTSRGFFQTFIILPNNPSFRYSTIPSLKPQHELEGFIPEGGEVFVGEVGIDFQ
jgi:hypothetical protein